MRRFPGIDLGEMPVADQTALCCFRRLLESHKLGVKIFRQVHCRLKAQGIKVGTGTIVDATIVAAPPPTKNKDGQRDPDRHQTMKGNVWHFGMKAHSGHHAQAAVAPVGGVVRPPGAERGTKCPLGDEISAFGPIFTRRTRVSG